MSRIRANTITNQNANGAPNFPDGITVTGIVTATTTSQNITGDLSVTGNIGVGGTLTYEDVTNIDSVGVITARSGIRIGATGANTLVQGTATGIGIGESSPLGKLHVKSADSGGSAHDGADELVVEGSGDSGISILSGASNNGRLNFGDSGDNNVGRLQYNHSDNYLAFYNTGTEKLRIGTSGQLGIAGANYGTSGQVLTSQGASSAIQWATISTPLVAYKAKEYIRNRYSYSGSTFHEIDNAFRIVHTPAATGNTIIIHTQIYHTIADGTYGGFANVTDQGSGSDESMLGEIGNPSGVAKGSILGGNYYNESIRQSAGGTIGLGSNLWGYHLTENTNSHTFKVFARMGSGTRYIGDNQPAQFMEMWEYSGNVMQ
jgi:hypothetical protein